jgi:glycosyltransferase involved in cell wall biosynthesis
MNLFVGKVDIFHGPFDNVQPVLGCKKIVTIHDLRYFDFHTALHDALPELDDYEQYAESYKGWLHWLDKMRERVSSAVETADHIITVSAFTRSSLIKHFQAKQKDIHVVHNGISPIFRPIGDTEGILRMRKEYGIEGEYFLHVGHLDPLKNILRIIDAYHRIKKNGSGLSQKLLFVTPTPKSYWFYKIVMEKIERLSLSRDVHFIHDLTDERVPYFYSGATALLLPSLYEGFGLPALEAMACGTPVIASNICSLPEVVGEEALFVDPYSISSISENMRKIASDQDLRMELAARGQERSRLFSWEKTARETLEIYNQVGRG